MLGLPADVTSLTVGAGAGDDSLPAGAFHVRNDYGTDDLGLDGSVSPAVATFTIGGHLLARGVLTATFAA